MSDYKYMIVGGGLAGASAIEGIRQHDPDGSILLISRENHAPYHRPPLSKDLWFGKKTLGQVAVHPDDFYASNGVELLLRREAVELDAAQRRVWDDHGGSYGYEKLLLATGGRPAPLEAGGDAVGSVHYFRTLEDYFYLAARTGQLQHVLVVGGGFIGVELAAALAHSGKSVVLLYADDYPLRRVLPRRLGEFVADYYRERGVETVSGDSVAEVTSRAGGVLARTRNGAEIGAELMVAGVGLRIHDELAEAAGLEVSDGIIVDDRLRTSDASVYGAGDAASFPCPPLGMRLRVEHWDNALQMGRRAGENMAGADLAYDHLPMFYSDLFDLGWEAVGRLDSRMRTVEVWKQELREGIVFYMEDDLVRGVLLWNVWERVEWGRELIRAGRPRSEAELQAEAGL